MLCNNTSPGSTLCTDKPWITNAEVFWLTAIILSNGVRLHRHRRWNARFVAKPCFLLGIRPELFYVLQGTLPFMSARLLYSWLKNKPIVHTAVDDLESFLWVLVWALVHIFLNEIGTTGESTVDLLVESFSSYSIRQIIIRESIIERDWEGVVFGGLFRDWLAISKTASFAIEQHVKTVSGSVHDVDLRQGASDQLEEYCTSIYREFIQTGHRHLESIGQYSDWKAVAEANPAWLK